MKKLVFLAVLGLLSACAGRERPEPILVPVATPCVTGDLPDEPPLVSGELTGDSGRDIGIIAGSAIELRAWGRALYGIANSCRAPASGTVETR